MQPPTVQTLDQLMQATNGIYDPTRQNITKQIGQAGEQGAADEQALYGQQNAAFKNIAQMASNKGMLFSGFTPDQQAQYNSTKFMPAMAQLRGKVQDNIARLQSALLGIDSDQRKQAMSMQTDQQNKLDAYNSEQDRRKFEQQQADLAYQREMEKLKQTQNFEASQNAANRSASTPGKPATDFLGYIQNQFKNAGGNLKASRQQQDRWAQQWFLDNGILDKGAQQMFWNLFNSTYNRPNDPTKDWLYKR